MLQSIENRFRHRAKVNQSIEWLTDNGPGYVPRETVSFGGSLGLQICTTAPYSPEINGIAKVFLKTFKRDYAYVGDLSSADRVREQLNEWIEDYNENSPHKGLGMRSPRKEYRRENRAS